MQNAALWLLSLVYVETRQGQRTHLASLGRSSLTTSLHSLPSPIISSLPPRAGPSRLPI